MRNTDAIINSICNYTNFHPALKAGLMSLLEDKVDIIYWNALNEFEDKNLEKNIKDLFSPFSSTATGSLAKDKPAPDSMEWTKKNKVNLSSFVDGKPTESQEGMKKHLEDKYKWSHNPYRNLDVTPREQAIADDAKANREAQANYIDVISKTSGQVGSNNIKKYIEKISSDVDVFVKLVTLLTDQIIKEAWIKAPETIVSVFGKKMYFLEAPAMAIRNSNVEEFVKESAILLELAEDISIYFVLQNANNDIKKSIEDIWTTVETKAKEKVNKADVPQPVKNALLLQEKFIQELSDSVWDIIPKLIEKHGDEFFLIIESDGGNSTTSTPISNNDKKVKSLFDAFNSSSFQAYSPIFETMYQELSVKKPFNWLLDLEEKLVDDKEIEKNLSYCGSAMVQQGLASQNDFSFPTIGKVSGAVAHKLVQTSYNQENGLGKLLDVRDSLWITSGFVPGTYGLILLLLNVSCAVMFVAHAEDIVGFDMATAYPKFNQLPIWEIFREGLLDLKQEIAKNKKEEPVQTEISNKSGKSGIKFNM